MLRRIASRMIVVLIAAVVVAYSVRSAEARSLRFRQPDPTEGAASPSDVVPPSPTQKGADCCPQYCIKYRHHATLRKTCRSCETYKTVLRVCDPCSGCTVDIPLCLPCCCDGAPNVCDRSGHFGRSFVTYEWCCGYRVKVVFGRCGDVTVHSYGR